MSNHLAIATVTASLARLLLDAAQRTITGAKVGTARPDGTGAVTPPKTGVNVYLYQISPNGALRNRDLPTRSADGRLVQRPEAALDLHYLLTFHGDDSKLEPQRLLGAVVRRLHEEPVLSRQSIQGALADDEYDYLTASDLAEAPESVKFTPVPLSLEELSKLWSVFFQKQYVLSVAYQASVVLIEAEAVPQTALPVQERNLYVLPLRRPVIERAESAEGAGRPLVMGSTLRLHGRHLRGEGTRVRVGGNEVGVDASAVTDTELEVVLDVPPFGTGELRAGVQGVQVIHPRWMGTPPVEHTAVESNVAPFVLHPAITPGAVTSAQVTVTVTPAVGPRQRVLLLLNERKTDAPAAHTFAVPARTADADVVVVPITGVAAGTYFVRLQVDGAESPLDLDPESDTFGPLVTVP